MLFFDLKLIKSFTWKGGEVSLKGTTIAIPTYADKNDNHTIFKLYIKLTQSN